MTRREVLARKKHFQFSDLLEIVDILRAPDGCPWDRAQTHKDLRNNFIEEAYEACEGIDQENGAILAEELGDVLLQVVFHAGIARDQNEFGMEDVLDGICKKMIRRHPHVFSNEAEKPDWDELKRKEKGEQSKKDALMGISRALPSLMRCEKILKKDKEGVFDSIPCSEDSTADALGREFFLLTRRCMEAGYHPEELLDAYLNKVLKNCTIYE